MESLKKPTEIAVVHIKGHQKGDSPEIKGNQLADQVAKEVALKPGSPVKIFQIKETPNEEIGENRPVFEEKELRELERIGGQQKEDEEWWTPDRR